MGHKELQVLNLNISFTTTKKLGITYALSIFIHCLTQATNPWPTDGDGQVTDEASREVPIPLIIGIGASAVIVLLVAFFIALFRCRKRKER